MLFVQKVLKTKQLTLILNLEAKNLRASHVKVDPQCAHSVSLVLTTALKFEFKAGREKTVTNYLSWCVNTASRRGIKQNSVKMCLVLFFMNFFESSQW